MRISDWSSDVCSSDLERPWRQRGLDPRLHLEAALDRILGQETCGQHHRWIGRVGATGDRGDDHVAVVEGPGLALHRRTVLRQLGAARHHVLLKSARDLGRSEEHTSELQSLMRISYAVFCLKKKK